MNDMAPTLPVFLGLSFQSHRYSPSRIRQKATSPNLDRSNAWSKMVYTPRWWAFYTLGNSCKQASHGQAFALSLEFPVT